MTLILTGRAEPREKPEDAWEDALKQEQSLEQYAKEEKVKPIEIKTGICPAHFV